MISRIILICILTAYNSALNTGKLNTYGISARPECQANKVYQKDDVTCFCNKYGRWPHRNCSLVFDEQAACTPDSYVQIDCNVCRCSKAGIIEREFCTNHICTADSDNKITLRRFIGGKNKCDTKHWYALSPCRLCYCISQGNLLCSAEIKTKNMLIGKFNLTDCDTDWLTNVNQLLASVNPLRLGNKNVNPIKLNSLTDPEIVQIKLTPIKYSKNIPKTLNLNQEIVGDKNVKIARNDDRSDKNDLKSSSESNSEEKVERDKPKARIAGNTAMPFENDEGNDSNHSNEVENDGKESENESADTKQKNEEADVTEEAESALDMNKNEPQIPDVIDQETDVSLLKLSLPEMLGKVFSFGLRKSMVSINDSNCVPGSTLSVKCNTCFCLTNGKMLCTKKICE